MGCCLNSQRQAQAQPQAPDGGGGTTDGPAAQGADPPSSAPAPAAATAAPTGSGTGGSAGGPSHTSPPSTGAAEAAAPAQDGGVPALPRRTSTGVAGDAAPQGDGTDMPSGRGPGDGRRGERQAQGDLLLQEERVVDLRGGELGLLTVAGRQAGELHVAGTAAPPEGPQKGQCPARRSRLGELAGWRISHAAPDSRPWAVVDSEAALRRACYGAKRVRLRFTIPSARRDEIVAGRRICRAWRRRKQQQLRTSVESLVFRLLLRQVDVVEECEFNNAARQFDVIPDSTTDGPPPAIGPSELPRRRLETIVKDLRQSRKLPEQAEAEAVVRQLRWWYGQQNQSLVHIPLPQDGRVYVVGDLHGHFDDLLYIVATFGRATPHTQFLFNGDFVDRGPDGVRTLLLIYAMKLLAPASVHLNRGNHEDEPLNVRYGFDRECRQSDYGPSFFQLCVWSFQSLPLFHVVDRSVGVVHGGLPQYNDLLLDEIERIDRIRRVPIAPENREEHVYQALLWSDPKELEGGRWEPSSRGAGVYWSDELSADFLTNNSLEMLLRSHQVVDQGHRQHHHGKVVTVFSASGYMGKDDNLGCVMELTRPQPKQPLVAKPHTWSDADKMQLTRDAAVQGLRAVAAPQPGSPRREVLRSVRVMLFAHKLELLEAYSARDDGSGTVSVHDWAEAGTEVIGHALAWRYLLPHLAPQPPGTGGGCYRDGRVAFMPFLERLQNPLTLQFMHLWRGAVFPHVRLRIARCCERLGRGARARLSFVELYEALRRGYLPMVEPRLLYFLVSTLDRNRDGFIDTQELNEAFGRARVSSADTNVFLLWELWRLGSAGGWQTLRQSFRAAEGTESGVACDEFARVCFRHFASEETLKGAEGAGDWQRWRATAAHLDDRGAGRVRWKTLQRAVQQLSEHEQRALAVCELVHTIARARVQLARACLAVDVNGDGTITEDELRRGLLQMLASTPQRDALERCWAQLWQLCDANGDGWVSYEEFLAALEVVDIEAASSTRTSPGFAVASGAMPSGRLPGPQPQLPGQVPQGYAPASAGLPQFLSAVSAAPTIPVGMSPRPAVANGSAAVPPQQGREGGSSRSPSKKENKVKDKKGKKGDDERERSRSKKEKKDKKEKKKKKEKEKKEMKEAWSKEERKEHKRERKASKEARKEAKDARKDRERKGHRREHGEEEGSPSRSRSRKHRKQKGEDDTDEMRHAKKKRKAAKERAGTGDVGG